MQPLEALLDADRRLLALIGELRSETMREATPCSAWDVRGLLSHTLESIEAFSAAVEGVPGPTEEELFSGRDIVGDAPLDVANRIIERSQSAWSSVTDLEKPVQTVLGPIPAGQALAIITFSTLVHSWDLATAMGKKIELTDDEVALGEAVASQIVPLMRPKGLFGPEIPTAASPTSTHRLMAFTGRSSL